MKPGKGSKDGLWVLSYSSLCKLANVLKCKRRRSKVDTIREIRRLHACRKVQRRWRQFLAVNDVCPLTQERWGHPVVPVRLGPRRFVYYSENAFRTLIKFQYHQPVIKDPLSGKNLPEGLVQKYKNILQLVGEAPPLQEDDPVDVLSVAIDHVMSECVMTAPSLGQEALAALHSGWLYEMSNLLNMLRIVCPQSASRKLQQCSAVCEAQLPVVFHFSLFLLQSAFL